MPKTYNDLLLDGRHILRHIGVEAAELESRELLAYAAGKDRQTLLRDLRLYVGEDVEPQDVKAKYENGVLKLFVPKAEVKQVPAQTAIAIE